MKKKSETRPAAILRLYGSLEAYNEEQRRFGLVAVETATRANPFGPRLRFGSAGPVEIETPETNVKPRRFRLKFFWQKA